MIKKISSFIYSLLPRRCAYCGRVIASDRLMCSDCERNLPRIKGTVCNKCGREKEICSCKGSERYYVSVVAPFYFEGNVRKGIHAYKFRKSPDNAEAYSSEMAKTVSERFGDIKFDYITDVPMTRKSVKIRGYNQCTLLAKGISDYLGIEYKPDLLVKLYETKSQHGLSFYFRRGNLTGVFDVTDPSFVYNKTILLCDDVSTSGETMNECAKMLWLYGAKEVYCIACALTKSKSKNNKERM